MRDRLGVDLRDGAECEGEPCQAHSAPGQSPSMLLKALLHKDSKICKLPDLVPHSQVSAENGSVVTK